MKNRLFEITINPSTGGLSSLRFCPDGTGMNWCQPDGKWGFPVCRREIYQKGKGFFPDDAAVVSITETADEAVSVYRTYQLEITVRRSFAENGNLCERFEIRNVTDSPVYLNRESFAVQLPFADSYTYAEECLTHRCHTHLWCAKHYSWVCALRMGPSEWNLGLALTEGSLDSYSQFDCRSNIRGRFEAELSPVALQTGETTVLSWELFPQKGWDDFEERLIARGFPVIRADRYTLFRGEEIGLTVFSRSKPAVIREGEALPVEETAPGIFRIRDRAETTGERTYLIRQDGKETYCKLLVKIPFAELAKKRADFLLSRQQCNDPESPLYGAFLIYDNDSDSRFFDNANPDWNASRERLNMALFLARYLQSKPSDAGLRAMKRFSDFIYREIYDKATGEVFNTIGKRRDMIRLYNAPGIMLFFAEMYFLTKETSYLDDVVRLAETYYRVGGQNCYSNSVSILRVLTALSREGYEKERERVRELFGIHVGQMLSNGLNYPKHEVNYEQTIVTPAVNCISEFGTLSDDREKYVSEVAGHYACLGRFAGRQPSYLLYANSVRYWDGFWFGKARQWGDTFPHHLSVLSARANVAYYRLTGDEKALVFAEQCIRDCLPLIGDDGRGHAARIYPRCTNGRPGEFYDHWANDQDLTLYDALLASELIPSFRI